MVTPMDVDGDTTVAAGHAAVAAGGAACCVAVTTSGESNGDRDREIGNMVLDVITPQLLLPVHPTPIFHSALG